MKVSFLQEAKMQMMAAAGRGGSQIIIPKNGDERMADEVITTQRDTKKDPGTEVAERAQR